MTVNFKVFLSLLFLCLLAAPGSAWEQTFENHANDEPTSAFVGGTLTIINNSNLRQFYTGGSSSYATLTINEAFDGYLSYTWYASASSWPDVGLALYNASGQQLFYDQSMANTASWVGYHRVEFIENSAGTAIECYVDGVKYDSTTYITSGEPASIVFYFNNENNNVYVDDFTSDYGIIGCDDEVLDTDTYQYFSAGYPYPDYSYMFANLYSPSGDIISSQNITSYSPYNFPTTLINSSGTYFIRLFQHDNLSNNDYFFASRSFTFDSPSGVSLTLDKEEYERSGQMQVFTYIPSQTFKSGYTVKIGYNTGSGTEYYTYSVPSSDYTKSYALSAHAVGGFYSVYLVNPSGNVVASDEYYMSAPDGSTTVSLDKSTYETSDTVKISYTGASTGSTLYMYLRDSSSVLYSKTWSVSGSEVKSFDLSSYPGTTIVYVKIVKDSILLADDRGTVFSGEYYLSGKVYNSVTKAAVEGAQISVNGSSTTTNEIGYYETPVNAGLQTITILCDGYQQFTSNVYISDLLSTQNFYIVPTSSTGSDTLYGVVVDYYTGSPVNSSYVQISNGSTTHSMLTNSKTGNYVFTQDGLAGTWTITVTKTNYDTYEGSVTISGDTYKQIRLVPTDGVDSEDSDSTDSTDRPSREAAEESLTWLEETIPGLVKLAVIVFMFALIGWRF
ncbi:MAG: hypothetical protein QG646_1680 [Euryarchaeota archaeon]|nr:hypothetical protein [Euryarchaeota archaeon]